jgi:hypothetical protein
MVNFLDFISLRSSSGLLRKGRRLALEIGHLLFKVIPKLENEIKQQISFANEKGTEEKFVEIINTYIKIEEDNFKLDKEEILIIDRALGREIESQKSINNFIDKYKQLFVNLNGEDKKIFNESVSYMDKVKKRLRKAFDRIRVMAKHVHYDNTHLYDFDLFIQKKRTLASEVLISEMERKLPNQRSASIKEKHLENNKIKKNLTTLVNLFNDLDKNKNLNKQKKDKLLKAIASEIKNLKANTKSLFEIIDVEMDLLSMVYSYLFIIRERLKKKEKELEKLRDEIKNEGISKEVLDKINKAFENLDNIIKKHTLDENKMAFHEQREYDRAGPIKKI